MRYLGGVQGEKKLRGDVAWFRECFEKYGFTLWVVERKSDGAFLGFCGLDRLEYDVPDYLLGRVEIGWRLREDAWGEGYATESARVSLDIAFRIRNMDDVISRADEGNEGSLRIMRKLGMRRAEELERGEGQLVHIIKRASWLEAR
jgi:RimJ/RimL family protein N-acetyltransferase